MENLTVVQLSASDIRAIIREELLSILSTQHLNTSNANDQNEIFSFDQTLAFLNIPVSTLYYYTSKNMIPHVKKGKKLFFVKGDLVEWIKQGKKKPEASSERKEDFFLLKLRKKGKIKIDIDEKTKKTQSKTL